MNSKRFGLPFRSTVTAFDRQLISQSLIDAESELKERKLELSRLKVSIMTVESRLTAVESEVEGYRSLLSPVQRMPPEILAEIFEHCCHDIDILGKLQAPTPVVISLVCGRWRDLAFSTPSLWASIRISIYPLNHWEPAYDWSLLSLRFKLFLRRSSTFRLKLNLVWCPAGSFTGARIGAEEEAAIMEILLRSAPRLQDLTLETTPTLISLPSFQRLRKSSFPILNRLEVSCCSMHLNGADLDVFENSPNLRSLGLAGVHNMLTMNLSWKTLRSLAVSGNMAGLRYILPQCTDLRRLELNECTLDEVDANLPMVLNVEHFSVSDKDGERLSRLIHHLELPRLQSLKIFSVSFVRFPQTLTFLEDLLRRSKCTISHLQLNSVTISDQTMISLLRSLPRIRQFTFCEPSLWALSEQERLHGRNAITPAFSRQLCRKPPGQSVPSLLSELTDLRLYLYEKDLDEERQRSLVDAIISRWHSKECHMSGASPSEGIAGLQSVEIVLLTRKAKSNAPLPFSALRCFKDAGLRVIVWRLYVPF